MRPASSVNPKARTASGPPRSHCVTTLLTVAMTPLGEAFGSGAEDHGVPVGLVDGMIDRLEKALELPLEAVGKAVLHQYEVGARGGAVGVAQRLARFRESRCRAGGDARARDAPTRP